MKNILLKKIFVFIALNYYYAFSGKEVNSVTLEVLHSEKIHFSI